jgi:pyrophosphatase PpaX
MVSKNVKSPPGVAPRAVVFDVDGTLLDTREFIFGAFEHALATSGVKGVTRRHIAMIMGQPTRAMYATLAPGYDVQVLTALHAEHHAAHLDLIAAYDDAVKVLDEMQRRGLGLGVFTGYHRGTHDRLREFKMFEYFSTIVESTRYEHHKPHPEGLELAMRELEVTPEQTVFIGDGVTDMEAGVRAGVPRLIGITHGFCTREDLEAHGATHIIGSLRELPALMDSFGVSERND